MNEQRIRQLILLAWIFTIGGIFGFAYEELFYRLDLHMWVKRGTTYGPWIPIYGFGAVAILLTTARCRRKPLRVFGLSMLVCGLLEFATGWALYTFWDTRLWDYNTEIWNWGNLGGYVCLRSVLFFGASALCLEYVIAPCCKALLGRIRREAVLYLSLLPFLLFVGDMIAYHLGLFG